MDPDIRLQRHAQLWEAGNTSVRRIALSSLIFAAFVLLRVVEPYHNKQSLENDLTAQETTAERVRSDLDKVRTIEATLDEIEQVVRAAPWDDANEELKRFFREGGGDARTRANRTVREIAGQIRDAVIEPLRDTIERAALTDELAALPDKVEKAIGEWEDGKIDNDDWYGTPGSKNVAVREVVDILQELRNQASEAVERAKAAISGRTRKLESNFAKVEKKIEAINKSIDEAISEALPSWAGKLISGDRMVMLYPWILVGFALYLVGSAVTASRHFRGMADEHGWTAEERSDPLLSSFWTLTWRGNIGTTITLATYSAVLIGLWYCLYSSQKYADPENVTILFGYGLMALSMITVWVAPWRSRATGAG